MERSIAADPAPGFLLDFNTIHRVHKKVTQQFFAIILTTVHKFPSNLARSLYAVMLNTVC